MKTYVRKYFGEYFIIYSNSENRIVTVEWLVDVAISNLFTDKMNKMNFNHHIFAFKYDADTKLLVSASAKCKEEDTFDEEFGIRLAIGKCYLRLLEYRFKVWKRTTQDVFESIKVPKDLAEFSIENGIEDIDILSKDFLEFVINKKLNDIRYHKGRLNKLLYSRYPELKPL